MRHLGHRDRQVDLEVCNEELSEWRLTYVSNVYEKMLSILQIIQIVIVINFLVQKRMIEKKEKKYLSW